MQEFLQSPEFTVGFAMTSAVLAVWFLCRAYTESLPPYKRVWTAKEFGLTARDITWPPPRRFRWWSPTAWAAAFIDAFGSDAKAKASASWAD